MSLMVHRIDNTLLIDEFDINKYLLRIEKAIDNNKNYYFSVYCLYYLIQNEWDWLKKFYYETVLQALSIKVNILK